MEMVKRLKEFGDFTTGEDRKMLAHSLFDEIVYDLDGKHIVDFTIKIWAEPFWVLRAALYDDEMGEEMKNRFNSGLSSRGTSHSPNGLPALETYLEFGGINRAKQLFLFLTYYEHDFSYQLSTPQRDQKIRERYKRGERISDLAREYGISPQRVDQIVRSKNGRVR
jgi:hypothetical protein